MTGNIRQIETVNLYVENLDRVQRLLSAIFPKPVRQPDPERYYCLSSLVRDDIEDMLFENDPNLMQKLRDRLVENALSLQTRGRLKACRALAILHWEMALDLNDGVQLTDQARQCYHTANRLWRHLLTDQAFWEQFADDHEIVDEHLVEVRQQIIGDILTHHIEQARSCLTVSNPQGSRFHLACLTGWIEAPHMPEAAQSSVDGSYSTDLAEEIDVKTQTLINMWISDFLRRAGEQLRSKEAIENLPVGISRDFEGAIAEVQPALEVMDENLRLLSFTVKQYNSYTFELAVAERIGEACEASRAGCALARRLAEKHLKPGDSLNPDNQTVYLTFQLAWQLEPDSQKKMANLEECRRWGGSNEEIEFQIVRQQARQALEENRYDEALEILDALDNSYAVKSDVIQLRSVCFFNRGFEKAKRAVELIQELASIPERFFEAYRDTRAEAFQGIENLAYDSLDDMQKAAELNPGEEIIHQDIGQIEFLAREAKFKVVIDAAHHVLNEDILNYYRDMLAPLESIPHKCSFAEIARKMRSELHYRLGVRAANDGDFEQGETDIRMSAQLDPADERLQLQLAQLYVGWAFSILAEARKKFKQIESSPSSFLAEKRNKFDNLMRPARKLHKQAMRKIDQAIAVVPEVHQKEIVETTSHLLDPEDMYWSTLLTVTKSVLEKEQSEYYGDLLPLLLKCPNDCEAKEPANFMAAAILFRRGLESAKEEQFKEAILDLEKAASLDPKTKIISEHLETIRRIASEAPFMKKFREAQNALKAEDYARALNLAESIPRFFTQYNHVADLLSVTYFKLYETAIKKKNLSEAIRYTEKSLEYNPGHPTLKENLKQLKEFKARGGFEKQKNRNKGIRIAEDVFKFLEQTQKNAMPLTPQLGRSLLDQLNEAVRLTDGDPQITMLRDQLQQALEGY